MKGLLQGGAMSGPESCSLMSPSLMRSSSLASTGMSKMILVGFIFNLLIIIINMDFNIIALYLLLV